MPRAAFLFVVLSAVAMRPIAAQSFPLAGADLADSGALARAMPPLAAQVLAALPARGRVTALDDSFRLKLVAGRFDDAAEGREALRELRSGAAAAPQARAADVQYGIYARARSLEASSGRPFAETYARAFRDAFAGLDDRVSALVIRALGAGRLAEDGLRAAIARQRGKDVIALPDALALLRAYQVAESYRGLGPLLPPLVAEDDLRRYVVATNVRIHTPDGATLCAMLVRPRSAAARVPALLQFTIYADSASLFGDARRTAANGYAAVMGFTRGKACSPDRPVPYVYDGADAVTVIEWISRQPWSDGRVGMYGGSYSGMPPWAAAKRRPEALKAIMVGAPVAPGLDVPMEGNIVWSFVYPWPFYTTDTKGLDDSTYSDGARWSRLYHAWYASGRAYRDLDRIDGTPNPIWDEWLAHPTYDAYWRAMIPYRTEFARIDIPVLLTAGYYYGGPGAALYYFTQHRKYRPRTEDYLVIGPYDHFQAQRGVVSALGDTATVLNGYEIDPVARMDITADLRYQWFDYVLRGGPKPALLRDRVNYEVVNGNEWKHAPSIAAMSNGTLRFYLSPMRSGGSYRLTPRPAPAHSAIPLAVDLADRSDSDRIVPGGGVADTVIDASSGIELVSDPLTRATELSGLFSGRLDFVANKRDFDFAISLYELTRDGIYLQLPPFQLRASFAGDPAHRRLLTPGARRRLDFRSIRLMSHRCRPESRLVMVLQIVKGSGQQINYGTGKDVSDETIADAGRPLRIRWYADSYLELPVRR
jgi:putative CocE/NonD family hydrolase